ncbi:hypothetical protein H5410_057831 [Solanum commersonii]|uniref:Uncharacterized protein n=1 Tax=Solanum commersonii TaxID=4109 RepID=A0A9J5WP90_SOLCO|nr:hypothetical protein H5410_057831 [Solanum commersonii]
MNHRETNYCKEMTMCIDENIVVISSTDESYSSSVIDFIDNDDCIEFDLKFPPASENMSFCLPKWSENITHLVYVDDTMIFSNADRFSIESYSHQQCSTKYPYILTICNDSTQCVIHDLHKSVC